MGQYGPVEACTIMRDPNGRSRGFAFLTYKSADSVTKVLAEVHHLDGKQVSRALLKTPLALSYPAVPDPVLTLRSTPNEPFPGRSTSVQPKSLSAVSPRQSHPSPFGSSLRSSDPSWTRRSCLTGRRDGPRDSHSRHSGMKRVWASQWLLAA
jgi:RNA recognition motif-containing protein